MITGGIIVKVNLLGVIEGATKSTTTQVHSVQIDNERSLTKEILHTDRIPTNCSRQFSVSEEVVNSWVYSGCPSWEEISNWKKYSETRKLISHINRFDEGYGVSFKFIEGKS